MTQAALSAGPLALLGTLVLMTCTGREIARRNLFLVATAATCLLAAAFAESLRPVPMFVLAAVISGSMLVAGRPLRHLEWPARLFGSALSVAGVGGAIVLIGLAYGGPQTPLGVVLGTLLLLVEIGAIALVLAVGLEIAQAVGSRPNAKRPAPLKGDQVAKVCIQVPIYKEPPELVRLTLQSLARLDYPDYFVQVVVNNTTELNLWMPIQAACQDLGERFQFVNLARVPGYKAGALNRATALLGEDVELVAIVDADYVVDPHFLRDLVPYFAADPRVGYVQTPQHYREWRDSAYLSGLFYAYRYLYSVAMPVREQAGATAFAGTMGLLRLKALRDAGGWAEWCVTEDSEASLRLQAQGWKSVYVNRPYGQGLMPIDFDGLKRQRYRWAFGAVQTVRHHLGVLSGRRASRLTAAQRYQHLLAGAGWLSDLTWFALTAFLLLASVLLLAGRPVFLPQLTGVLLLLPFMALVTLFLRYGWALRAGAAAPWRDVPMALALMVAVGPTVAQASVRALFSDSVPIRPVPQPRKPSPVLTAARSTWQSLAVAAAFAFVAIGLAIFGPRPFSLLLALACASQALAWGSPLAAAVISTTVGATPERGALRSSAQNTGERPEPESRRRLLLVPVLGLALVVLLVPTVYTAPPESNFASDPWQHSLPAPDVASAAAAPRPSALPTPPPPPSPSVRAPSPKPVIAPSPLRSTPSPKPPVASPSPSPPPPSPAPSPTKKPKGKPSPTPT